MFIWVDYAFPDESFQIWRNQHFTRSFFATHAEALGQTNKPLGRRRAKKLVICGAPFPRKRRRCGKTEQTSRRNADENSKQKVSLILMHHPNLKLGTNTGKTMWHFPPAKGGGWLGRGLTLLCNLCWFTLHGHPGWACPIIWHHWKRNLWQMILTMMRWKHRWKRWPVPGFLRTLSNRHSSKNHVPFWLVVFAIARITTLRFVELWNSCMPTYRGLAVKQVCPYAASLQQVRSSEVRPPVLDHCDSLQSTGVFWEALASGPSITSLSGTTALLVRDCKFLWPMGAHKLNPRTSCCNACAVSLFPTAEEMVNLVAQLSGRINIFLVLS